MPPVMKPKAAKPANPCKDVETKSVISGQLQKKMQKQKKIYHRPNRGLVIVRHLPHGFFEEQLRKFFEQFGTVTRLRLARSEMTGGPKGHAYVEFEYPEVAQVAAETMNNYLMFNKVLKTRYVPPERQAFGGFFKTTLRQVKNKVGKTIYVSSKIHAKNRYIKKFNNPSEESYQKRTSRKLNKLKKLEKAHADLGIDFSKFLVGSKKVEKKEKSDQLNDDDLPIKSAKRKVLSEDNKAKKLNQVSAVKSSGPSEDSVSENISESNQGNDSISSIDVKDLLGETLNESSDDDEWALEDGVENSESDEETDEDEQLSESENYSSDIEQEEEEEDEMKPSKISKAQKTVSKRKNAKQDNFEKLIKHKKNTGGIQKASKALSKKSNGLKLKNALQTAMIKQLAKPLPSIKNKIGTKKQKILK